MTYDPFIVPPAFITLPGPYLQKDSRVFYFPVKGKKEKIQETVDRFFKSILSDSNISYEVFTDYLGLGLAYVDQVTSLDPVGSQIGYVKETDFGFWVPLIKKIDGKADSLIWCMPYIVVDSPAAMTVGREVFGFNKNAGIMTPPTKPVTPEDFGLQAFSFVEFGPDKMGQYEDVFTLKKQHSIFSGFEAISGDIDAFLASVKGMEEIGTPWQFIGSLINDFLRGVVPMVFLKQFRSASDPHGACYQAVVETNIKITKFSGIKVHPNVYTLKSFTNATYPLVDSLGLGSSEIDVDGCMQIDMDFEAEMGRVVHQRRPKKVAVLGGGLGSMAALIGIVSAPDWSGQYEFTVYEKSWRLGGKGASGREPVAPTPEDTWGNGSRILEHGLHIWLGFYDNAFHYIQAAFASMGEDWSNFYTPLDMVVFQEDIDGKKDPWAMKFPDNKYIPGTEGEFLSPVVYLKMAWQFFRENFDKAGGVKELQKLHSATLDGGDKSNAAHLNFFEKIEEKVKESAKDKLEDLIEGIFEDIEKAIEAEDFEALAKSIELFRSLAPWNILEAIFNEIMRKDAGLRHIFIMLDITFTVVYGMIKDDILFKGFDSVNNIEFTDWMKKYGASKWATDTPLIKSLYDLVFGYTNGDVTKPNVAAGVGLYSCMRMIMTYKGHMFWKMNMGMGDTIFTPMEKYLASKGVKFKYFQQVDDLILSEDKNKIETIKFTQTANLKDPSKEYDPYVMLPYDQAKADLWPCWPEQVLWDQIEDSQAQYYKEQLAVNKASLESPWLKLADDVKKYDLVRGIDFDEVICGITLRALAPISTQISAARPQWKDMLEKVPTVITKAYQLWFKDTAYETGYRTGEAKWDHLQALNGGYSRPWGTQADMTHLLAAEDWKVDDPKYLMYSCCTQIPPETPVPLTDHHYPMRAWEEVKTEALDWLSKNAGYLWPNCAPADNPNGLDMAKLDSTYWRSGINFTEHYVMSPVGSIEYRLQSEDVKLDNFYITGDWTRNVINAGCVESTVMSGLFCARAVTGWNIPIYSVDPSKKGVTGT